MRYYLDATYPSSDVNGFEINVLQEAGAAPNWRGAVVSLKEELGREVENS